MGRADRLGVDVMAKPGLGTIAALAIYAAIITAPIWRM